LWQAGALADTLAGIMTTQANRKPARRFRPRSRPRRRGPALEVYNRDQAHGYELPELARDPHSRALEIWAIELVSPTTGHERRAFARYQTIARAVGSATIEALEQAGLLEIWRLGPGPTLTPWGIESGPLISLTPLAARWRGVRLAERPARVITAYRVRRRRHPTEEIQYGPGLLPFWEDAAQPLPPIFPRRQRSTGAWLELVPDPNGTDD
jgi:hypothetical protein